MKASATRRRPPARTAAFVVGLALLTWIALELLVLAAYRPITGAPFGAPIEAAARDVDAPDVVPGRERAGLGFKDPSMSLHPYLGYVFTPGSLGPDSPIAISDDGFLDVGPAIRRRDPSRVLVGIVGGSVAGQLGTWHAETFREALRGVPAFAGREIELVRLGMPGYHQPQQVLQLSWILAQGGEFDVLVNIDGFNEVAVPGALNVPKGAHPLFPMNWSMVARDVPDPALRRSIGAVAWLGMERRRAADSFASSPLRVSPIARLRWKLRDLRLERAAASHAWTVQSFDSGEVPWFVSGPKDAHEPPGGLVPWCVGVWSRASRQLHALADASGTRYLHVLQPNQYVPGSKPLSREERRTAYEAESPYRAAVEEGYPLLREAGGELTEQGVEFLDLSMLFEEVSETLYSDSCCHYNAEGNRLLSAAIARALR